MYCDQCGKELKSDDKYCPYCGAFVNDPITTKPKKSRTVFLIVLFSIVIVIVSSVALYMLFFRNVGTMMLIGRAFNNIYVEIEERYNATPLPEFEVLGEILKNGSITADFVYTTSFLGGWISVDVNGQIKLLSDTEARNFALEVQIGAYGESIDLDFYMNKERMALRMRLLGNNFYGLNYDTFREDIRILGNQIGLDRQTTDMYADIIDQINTVMNAQAVTEPGDISDIYSDITADFIRNLKITRSRERVKSTDDIINGCRTVEISVPKNTLIKLLKNISENENAMQSQYGILNIIFSQSDLQMFAGDYDLFKKEFNKLITDIERYYTGDIKADLFIDKNDRLARIYFYTYINFDGSETDISATLCFGTSVNDEWMLNASYTASESFDYITLKWNYEDRTRIQINSITAETNNIEPFTAVSEWDRTQGHFMLTFADNDDSRTVSGNITTTESNLYIKFDEIRFDDSGNKLNAEITTQTDIRIDEIDYINIDKWGSTILEAFIGTITNLLLLIPG